MSLASYIEQQQRLRIFREETRASLAVKPTLGVGGGASTPAGIADAWLSEQETELGLSPGKSNFERWLGPVSKGLTLASGILQATQSFKAAGSYRSQYRQYKLMAKQALEQGFQTGIDIERQGRQVVGSMVTSFGKSGSLLEGSPLLVLADAQARIQDNVSRAIRQGRIEYASYMRAARQAKKAASSAKIGGIGKIAGAVLSVVPGLNPVGATLGTAGGLGL